MSLNLFKNFNIRDVTLLFLLTKFHITILKFRGPPTVSLIRNFFHTNFKKQKKSFADVLQNRCS